MARAPTLKESKNAMGIRESLRKVSQASDTVDSAVPAIQHTGAAIQTALKAISWLLFGILVVLMMGR
jgi:hypothetical protein